MNALEERKDYYCGANGARECVNLSARRRFKVRLRILAASDENASHHSRRIRRER